MTFLDFASAYGLIIDRLVEGRWARVKTTDKIKKRNGSYKFMGDVGFVQNHATMEKVAVWKPDGPVEQVDRAAMRRMMAESARIERERQQDARAKAEDMVKAAKLEPHPYLAAKGFPTEKGLVLDGELLVPMREFTLYRQINSVQRIKADGTKLFLPGGKAKGSVFFIGPPMVRENWYCEGYANGLTLVLAAKHLHRQVRAVVCFSASNLAFVAKEIGRGFVYADNDESLTGQRAAESTGLPWTMSETVGHDVNDDFLTNGIGYVCKQMRALTVKAA